MTVTKPLCALVWIIILCHPISTRADISVSGLSEEAEANVSLTLSLGKEKCDTPEWKIRQLFAVADKEIDQAMRAIGYYHASNKNKLTFGADCWQAEFEIDAGPPVIIESVEITIIGEAKDDAKFQELREKLADQLGMRLNHADYEKMKSRIESLAMERGYFKNRFTEKNLLIDKSNNSAHIQLTFDSGQRQFFGPVSVAQDILDADFVNKFITLKSGEHYSSESLAETYNNLSKSGYFDNIDIHPQLEHIDQDRVPVSLTLYPKKTHHYSIGAGYDTDKGPLLAAAYGNRRLNREGHFLTSEIDLSPVLSTADIEYNVPLENPLSTFFSFGGGLKREDTDTYESLSAKISARLQHTFENGWKQTLFLDEIYESFTAATEDRSALLLLPGGSWLRSVADNPLRPTKGYRLEFNIAGTYQNPLSNISMVQGSMAAVWTHPVPWDGRVILRAEQGATTVDQFDELPTTYRFYAGGMNSIRGYSYKELGPKNENGDVIGGRFLSVVSVEYEQSIMEDWGVAAFIDSGNAYNLNDINIKTGVGLGVRWYSPIGPVRIDFALPMNESDSSFQFHFAAGTRL